MVALSTVHYLDAYLELSCISRVTRQPPSPYLAGANSTLTPLDLCVCVRPSFVFSNISFWLSTNLL